MRDLLQPIVLVVAEVVESGGLAIGIRDGTEAEGVAQIGVGESAQDVADVQHPEKGSTHQMVRLRIDLLSFWGPLVSFSRSRTGLRMHPSMQPRVGAPGGSQMDPLGDLLDRQRRLLPQPGGQGHLLGIPLGAAGQVALVPPQPPQFLPHDPFALSLGGLAPQLARVMLPANLPPGLLTSLGQRLEEIVTVHLVPEDVFPAVAPAHHRVDGPGILDSRFSRHSVILARFSDGCKNNNAQYDRLTLLGNC